MKTVMAKTGEVESPWYVVDVANKTLGRVATQIAAQLRGKNSVLFTPHVLVGPHIIIINAGKIKVTGKKAQNKVYEHYTGHPGGLKSERFESLFARFPTRVIEKAIKGMLPKNPLGRAAFKRLRVYAGEQHPHVVQKPQLLQINE